MSNNKKFKKPKKDFSNLKESKYVQKWLKNVKSDRKRLGILKKYCNFIEKGPDKLILEHHEDQQKEPIKRTNIAKNQLKQYFKYLIGETINGKTRNRSISINSARQYVYSRIASFYKRNGVPIHFQKGEIPKEKKGVSDKVWRNGKERIGKDKQKMCIKMIKDSFKNTRDKAILLCKKSSGLDDVDLFNLKIRDYFRGYYKDLNVCYLEGYRQKTDMYYQTFLDSEACTMLQIYFRERNERGEDILDKNGNLKREAYNEWLFVSEKANSNGTYRKIKKNAFSENLKSVCETLDIHNVTPKSFRRWFNSVLKRNGINHEIVERMMGHKTKVSQKYNMVFEDPEAFTELYVEDIEPITLLGNGNQKYTKLDHKVEELEIENQYLRNKVDKITEVVKNIVGHIKDNSELIDSLTQIPQEPKEEKSK